MQKPHALLRGLFASVDNFCGGENFLRISQLKIDNIW